MLSMFGFKSTESDGVSEEELRLIVTGAKMSGGIESQEGRMIEGVLDLQVRAIALAVREKGVEVACGVGLATLDAFLSCSLYITMVVDMSTRVSWVIIF